MVASIGDLRASVRLNWKMLLICAGLTAFTGCTWYAHRFSPTNAEERQIGYYGLSISSYTLGGVNQYKHSSDRTFNLSLVVAVRERSVPDDSIEVAQIRKRLNFWSVLVQSCQDNRTLAECRVYERLAVNRDVTEHVDFRGIILPDSIQDICVKIPYTYTEHGTEILCDTLRWKMYRTVNKFKALMVD